MDHLRDPSGSMAGPLSGIVLTGGTGARLGGTDKAALRLENVSLLDHALTALAGAEQVVVVGPPATTARPVAFVREDPPLSGPAAGLLAGADHLAATGVATDTPVVLLAVDMPRVTAATVARLLAAADGHDGAFLLDPAGYRQLCGVVALGRLLAASPPPADRTGLSVRRLLAPLDLAGVPAEGQEARDVDTWEDLASLKGLRPDGSRDRLSP